ncbi:MAG: choice-of-anchor D domain-containing protein [Archangium sp.]|nr:choice-of-anchor D domain-containing protein [Archangium sp.]
MRVMVAAVAVMISAGCGCQERTSKRVPAIDVIDDQGAERLSVDFGRVQVNVEAEQLLRVRNPGSSPLTIQQATVTNAQFSTDAGAPLTIGFGEEVLLPLHFTPTTPDVRTTGTLTLVSDDPAKPQVVVSLSGTGIAAVAVPMPTTLAFGNVYVNERKSLDFTLTNAGSAPLPVSRAAFTVAVPSSVTADLAPLVTTLAAGQSVMVSVTFAPTQRAALGGALEIELPDALGTLSIPVQGVGVQAVPKACFAFDDSSVETCADAANIFVNVAFGSLCDSRLYPPDGGPSPCRGVDGGAVPYTRSGRVIFRNDGNTPVSYSLVYQAQSGSTCSDGGSAIDFRFSNAPNDGGAATWPEATTALPRQAGDAPPWATAPVAVQFRPTARCLDDAADQARLLWTRQGEPATSMRTPTTMIVNFVGQSLLPKGVPSDVTMTGTVPQTVEYRGVLNGGEAPLRVTGLSLWQSESFADGGHGSVPFAPCDPVPTGDCRFFSWQPGFEPSAALPVTLAGTSISSSPTSAPLTRLTFGPADGGELPMQGVEYRVFSVAQTEDPFNPQVISTIRGRVQ